MKVENLLIIGGLGVIAYLLFTGEKRKRAIEAAKIEAKNQAIQPKTTVVRTKVFIEDNRGSSLFPESIYKRYNSSKMATVAPAKATVTI